MRIAKVYMPIYNVVWIVYQFKLVLEVKTYLEYS